MNRLALLLPLGLAALAAACSDDRTVAPPPAPNTNNCGNGRLDRGETCDRLIPTSSVGACPIACDDGIACTVDRKLGSPTACNVECAFDPVTTCTGGDGCCPMGCSGANDSDCSTTCGNGTVEASETCDGDCPASCDDNIGCTLDAAYGGANSCSLTCGYRVVGAGACANGDGCCAPGCTADQDNDCSRTCGNGTVEAGETCDGSCPATCEDGDACTKGVASGSADTCNLSCTQQRIRSCVGADGCCPAGCTSANDSDCTAPSCSGVTTCTGGDGCCPASCTSASDSDCSAPSCSGVTACTGGDGCCPSGCTNASDRDCPGSPAAGVGSPCQTTTECASLGASATCFRDGFSDGYCTLFCTSEDCPSGSQCDLELFFCVDECLMSNPNDCRSGYACTAGFNKFEQTYFGCKPSRP